MKLEVGMYVRTRKGIAKVAMLDDLDNVAWTDNKDIFFGITRGDDLKWYVYDDGMVLSKPSFDLIDLIEEGDYVNGKYVYENGFDFYGKRCLHMQSSTTYACEVFLYEEDIKDIVTKEQFESMKYEVKE